MGETATDWSAGAAYIDGYGECDPTHAIRLFNVGELHSIEDWLPAEEFTADS